MKKNSSKFFKSKTEKKTPAQQPIFIHWPSPLSEEEFLRLRNEGKVNQVPPPYIPPSYTPKSAIIPQSLSAPPPITFGSREIKILDPLNIAFKKRLETVLNKQWFVLDDDQMSALRTTFVHFENSDAAQDSLLQKAARLRNVTSCQEHSGDLEFYFDGDMAIVNISPEFFKKHNLNRETFAFFLCAFIKTADKKVLIFPQYDISYPLKLLQMKAVYTTSGLLQMQLSLDYLVTQQLTLGSEAFQSCFNKPGF